MSIPETMQGVVLTGHGGAEKLVWREDLPVPVPAAGEVLIRVAAAAVNNTDINTRIGWYSKSVRGSTSDASAPPKEADAERDADGGWAGEPIRFPRIQGADCCGEIVAVGEGVPDDRIGERVLVRALQTTGARMHGAGQHDPKAIWTFGSECDGSFAQFTKTWAEDALPVLSDWTDLDLATIPCAWSTAEAMLQRIGLGAERVLITGASGGVGLAAIQLAARRSADITAVSGADKAAAVRAEGAAAVIGRNDPFPADTFDAVVDLVGGGRFPDMLGALVKGGRYVTAGAIAGPITELDLRTLYLRDLTLHGSTWQPANILPDVIGYVEAGELRPVVAEVFDLRDIHAAQAAFIEKKHVGKIALRVAAN